jgi:hypothetical protein
MNTSKQISRVTIILKSSHDFLEDLHLCLYRLDHFSIRFLCGLIFLEHHFDFVQLVDIAEFITFQGVLNSFKWI